MLEVNKIPVGNLNTNCYVAYDNKTKNGVLIDAGAEFDKIYNIIQKNGINLKAVFLTHGHFDHIGACNDFQKLGIPIYIHEKDADKCENNKLNLSSNFSEEEIQTFKPDYIIKGEEQVLQIENFKILAIHTPGHSEGSCCFIIENYLFSGDTIFEYGYGRTDFYDGSNLKLRQSIKKLLPYTNEKFVICDGHTN